MVAAPVFALAFLVFLFLGSVKLLRFHRSHLAEALKREQAIAQLRQGSGREAGTLPQRSTVSVTSSNAPAAEASGRIGNRRIEVTFKDSPLFTKERRSTISSDINRFATYLGALGLPIPSDIPPIGIDTSKPKAVGWSFNEQSNNKYYYNTFTLQQGALDDREKITEAFTSFVVGRFIYTPPIPFAIPDSGNQTPQQFYDATHTPEQMDRSYRWAASVPLTLYLNTGISLLPRTSSQFVPIKVTVPPTTSGK
jgi:hypothetical protein